VWPRRERLTYSPIVNGILESEGKIAGPRTPAMAMAPTFQKSETSSSSLYRLK